MSQYPEHDRLRLVQGESQACGAFLDWLREEKGYTLAAPHYHSEGCKGVDGFMLCDLRNGELFPVSVPVRRLLAEFFEIDEERLEREKQQLLREVRTLADERTERVGAPDGVRELGTTQELLEEPNT